MKFTKFIEIYSKEPLIDSSTFSYYENEENLRRQVLEWVKKGYLLPLKKGIYILNEEYRKKEPSLYFIANFLVSPSYISLEYALNYYNLIPERTTVITSVTTKKTNSFENVLGKFEYRSVKNEMFQGFKKETEKKQDFFIAAPEKALVDYFYLNSQYEGNFDEFESLRLQNLERLNPERLNLYKKVSNARVSSIIEVLIEFIKHYKKEYQKL